MRDHPAHAAYMMGGTWGAKVNQMRNRFLDAFKKLFKDAIAYVAREEGGGWDQIALVRYVYCFHIMSIYLEDINIYLHIIHTFFQIYLAMVQKSGPKS